MYRNTHSDKLRHAYSFVFVVTIIGLWR